MADDEQFSLCWNNFNTNLSAGFHESLVQGDLVDVTLAAEGQLVKAHRLILSVCSPYFRKMFTQMPVNQHAFIFLKDVSHSALKDLIQFMYCGEVNVKQDALPAFISTAEALQIKGLTETGDSAPPPQPSPAKENIPTTPAPVSISTNTGSARGKVQRSRVQSYKLESEESGDDKIVQIQSSTSHHSATASQQAQQIQQVHVATGQKRILGQRILAPSMTNKRAKLSVSGNDILDPSEATTQIQAVQIVKQLPSQTTEPEYVEMALEPISTKAEPDYSEEHTEIETVEAETEQDQSLAEHDQSADQEQEQGDDEGTYVEDEAYGDMAKYEESYFTEGEEGKAGVSGFAEPYTSDGTGNEQAAQGLLPASKSNRECYGDSSLSLSAPKHRVSPLSKGERTGTRTIPSIGGGSKLKSKKDVEHCSLVVQPRSRSSFPSSYKPNQAVVKFIRSQKKCAQLVYGGYIYNRKITHQNGRTTWRCSDLLKYHCRATCVTKQNKLISVRRQHQHENHLSKIVKKLLYDYPEDLEEYLNIYTRDPIDPIKQEVDVIDAGEEYKIVLRASSGNVNDGTKEEVATHSKALATIDTRKIVNDQT
ncbi:modifier of mdg4-like isoform X1 [Anopheles cruzii]|uniref:modifier of mdg4-like isoform X1 n=1 Tax=Anopheles cruzii TaxID=68878 RepID=UPI0022EC72D5|nr:modifier of mdg4-like isoform X1 [Anopheles cruzii]XP_052864866.1 modifier of mdg4-like isoform X1 [Anopheles cruzii]